MNFADNRKHSIYASSLPPKVLYPEDHATVIVLVGLPARGKSFISKRLSRYLNWIGVNTRVFNVGDYRRQAVSGVDNNFFSKDNPQGEELRNQLALKAFQDLSNWLNFDGGEVAIFDATNTTRSRRAKLMEECRQQKFKYFFVESFCNDPAIIEENIVEVKLTNPDYTNMPKDEAVKDFVARIHHYEERYEPMDEQYDEKLPYIVIHNQGKRYVVNRIFGNLRCRIVYYLMNLDVGQKVIYITRHCESEYNIKNIIGGNSDITERGKRFALKLREFMCSENIPYKILTSLLRRTIQTAEVFTDVKQERWKALNELNAGICEEMSYGDMQRKYPEEFNRRQGDKYNYRYPMGESYQDLVSRLEPIIMELEQRNNILVISHVAVSRCLLAYFGNYSKEKLPYLDVPLHTIFKVRPTAYGCVIQKISLIDNSEPIIETLSQ